MFEALARVTKGKKKVGGAVKKGRNLSFFKRMRGEKRPSREKKKKKKFFGADAAGLNDKTRPWKGPWKKKKKKKKKGSVLKSFPKSGSGGNRSGGKLGATGRDTDNFHPIGLKYVLVNTLRTQNVLYNRKKGSEKGRTDQKTKRGGDFLKWCVKCVNQVHSS